MEKDFTDSDVVYMCETILGYLDMGRVDEAKQHLENLQRWFVVLPQYGNLVAPSFTGDTQPIKRMKYSFDVNTLTIKLFGIGDSISIIVQKLDEVIVELNKLIIKNKK
jgi:hypothetical protein